MTDSTTDSTTDPTVSPAFAAPPGPRFPGLFALRDRVPGPAFTPAQLDKAATILSDGALTVPFILSIEPAPPHPGEWYVFFRDPLDPRKAKRNMYQWVKADDAEYARLLFDYAPGHRSNLTTAADTNEGGKRQ